MGAVEDARAQRLAGCVQVVCHHPRASVTTKETCPAVSQRSLILMPLPYLPEVPQENSTDQSRIEQSSIIVKSVFSWREMPFSMMSLQKQGNPSQTWLKQRPALLCYLPIGKCPVTKLSGKTLQVKSFLKPLTKHRARQFIGYPTSLWYHQETAANNSLES